MLLQKGRQVFPEYEGMEIPCNGCSTLTHIEDTLSCAVIYPAESNKMTFFLVCYVCTLNRIKPFGEC